MNTTSNPVPTLTKVYLPYRGQHHDHQQLITPVLDGLCQWTRSLCEIIQQFYTQVSIGPNRQSTSHQYKKNLTPPETRAIREIYKKQEIIIKLADKGGSTVRINIQDYIQEGKRQLATLTIMKCSIFILDRLHKYISHLIGQAW